MVFCYILIIIFARATQAGFSVGQGVSIDTQNGPKYPNVTGHFPFTGFDLSKPFPGTVEDGWSLDIQVIADMPANISKTGDEGFVTLSRTYITPPGGNITLMDDSWKVCAHHIGRAPALGDDGTCAMALGQECVDAIPTQANVNETDNGGGCFMFLPRVCENHLISDSRVDGVWPGNSSINSPLLTVVEDGNSAIHQGGNYTAYDGLEGHVDIILLAFKSSNESVTDNNTVLRCVRATNTVEGGRVPATGSMKSVSTSLIVGLNTLAGLLLMF